MQLKSRIIAVPLAAVLASGAFFSSAPAQAAPKSKTYKAGAIALGALGAYMLSKGKTVPGAIALGGGYLAYRKGEKERKDEKYDNRYGRNDNWNNRNDGWNNRNDNWNNRNDDWRGNGNYGNTYYNGNADYRYNNGGNWNNRDRDNDHQCRDNDNRGNNRRWNR